MCVRGKRTSSGFYETTSSKKLNLSQRILQSQFAFAEFWSSETTDVYADLFNLVTASMCCQLVLLTGARVEE